MCECIQIRKKDPSDVIVALVGSPNVGKSTLFNVLTGRNQHTGNWPGKTVAVAQGRYHYKGRTYILVDLPGTYSLISRSQEEQVTTEFLQSGQADCTLVLADATCLERTLLPVLQVMELTNRLIVGVNLMDEAERKGITVKTDVLERELGVPTVGISAGCGTGLDRLREKLRNLADGFAALHPRKVELPPKLSLFDWQQGHGDRVAAAFSCHAEAVADAAAGKDRKWVSHPLDRLAMGRITGPALLAGLLFFVFWLTIKAANVPSDLLEDLFNRLGEKLLSLTVLWPWWLRGILLEGIYETVSCVVSVMLPPLLIFFPLFSLLEDFGYLPRAAFLLDHCFQRCGSCGKQALTMAMGFGCNAAGVTGARIITSRKERLLAIVTNSLVPCNGRFPAMIVLIGLLCTDSSLAAALVMTLFVLLGVVMTFLSSGFLSKTVFCREPSGMILELPPYRRPNLKTILSSALWDRVLGVLGRAAAVSAPAGACIWLLQVVQWKEQSLLVCLADWLDPIGAFLGMNGVILTAFLLAIPANELLLPGIILIMDARLGTGSETALLTLWSENGWGEKTALCTLLFLLFHWPCSTTCLTIRKETGSWRWTAAAILLPVAIGVFLCALVSNI